MIDGAVGTAEVATGETELRDFDGALGSDVSRAVVVDLDEFEVVEDLAVEIECRSGGAPWNVRKVRSPWVMGSTLTTSHRNCLVVSDCEEVDPCRPVCQVMRRHSAAPSGSSGSARCVGIDVPA